MDVRAEEFGLKFTNTSLASLMTFIEDAVTSVAMPMHVDVNRFLLTLQVGRIIKGVLAANKRLLPRDLMLT
jgi:hypothetical protein